MHNIKVSKQSTKEEKHRERVLKSPGKSNTHTNWNQTERKDIKQKNITFSSHSQAEQQNKTKLENKKENHSHAQHKS